MRGSAEVVPIAVREPARRLAPGTSGTRYETFHVGAQFVTGSRHVRICDWAGAERMLNVILEGDDTAWAPDGAREAAPDAAQRR